MSDIEKDGSADTIGNRIKSLRRSVGLSQANLGESLGVTFQQIQKYESGRSRIAADKLQRIAQALNVDVNYFYDCFPSLPACCARSSQGDNHNDDRHCRPELVAAPK
jgi:transcriptional regulator with XRE-family HTH domain